MRDSTERDLAVADTLGEMADARIKELETENAALREQLAGYKSCVTCACGRPTWHRKEDAPL